MRDVIVNEINDVTVRKEVQSLIKKCVPNVFAKSVQ